MIIRRIRIGKLTGYYPQNDLKAINFIQSIIENTIKTNYECFEYYHIKNKIYFELCCSKFNYLWFRNENFCEVLKYKYFLSDNDITHIIYYMIEKHLKIKVDYSSVVLGDFYEKERQLWKTQLNF